MKTVNVAVSNAIRQNVAVQVVPKLIAEWNLNRYYSVTADNILPEDTNGYDVEMFPIESIYAANRPTKGIVKARVGASMVAADKPASQYSRFYMASVDDVYKYWCSPVTTDSSGNFANHTDGESVVRPYVAYSQVIQTNKIVIKTESTWATPKNFTIKVRTTVGGAWTNLSVSPTVNANGEIIVYYNGTTWVTTAPTGVAQTTGIAGIQLRVNGLQAGTDLTGATTKYYQNGVLTSTTGANSYFELIEISARRYDDLTSRLINVDDDFEMSEKSEVYPIGTTTANIANITLANYDSIFNKDNATSPYYGLLKENVHFTLSYVYTVSGTTYEVPQFKMYGGTWAGTNDDEVSLELRDHSKFFDETKPTPVLYNNRSVAEIMWRLCDTIGFVNYQVDSTDVSDIKIPWFWSDGEKTLWALLDELSQATQTAIWFDGNGVLQIRTRESAFDTARTVDWTLRGITSGANLADISSLDQSETAESNYITVNYYSTDITHIDKDKGAIEKMDIVWQPTDTVTLRASVLTKSLGTTDTYLTLTPTDAQVWPYSGIMQVEGELIRYAGKRFRYYVSGVANYANVTSLDEQNTYNNQTALDQQHLNGFTGEMLITERGVWNSEVKAHVVDAAGYTTRGWINNTARTGVGVFKQYPTRSQVYLNSGTRFKSASDIFRVTRGAEADATLYHYGTRMMFTGTERDQKAGIVINSYNSNFDGYYIELTPTAKVDRKKRNEILLFGRSGGSSVTLGKGSPVAVGKNIWYDLDILFQVSGANHIVKVFLNGRLRINATISGGNKVTANGKFGLFTRGQTAAYFEYLYAINNSTAVTVDDDTSFKDWILGGYTGRRWDAEWVYDWHQVRRRVKKKWTKVNARWKQMLMDEFGPYAHEVREYDIKYDPKPVLHGRLMLSNQQAICTEFNGTSFGAKFILANTARTNVVLQGEDTLTDAGTGDSINQQLLIYGRTVTAAEAATIIVKNDAQISAFGQIETQIDSPWIQSEDAGQALADWISAHWSTGADELEVQIFGNSLIEVGDVVNIDYPRKYMTTATHVYFVLGVKNEFSNGLVTTLTLRRKV